MGDLMEVLKTPSKIKIFAWKALDMLSIKKKSELGIKKKVWLVLTQMVSSNLN
jgi:hypothetical protein